MIEFRTDLMTEPELLEAANRIYEAEEKDFNKIKSEKWYQTLFHAITLNQDGKKYAVKGIHSLAKLQQLFIEIYLRNYRHQNQDLDSIIDSVTTNSAAIKKLYGTCVLELEEQEDLSSLDANDSQILALFLGEYRNADGVVPENVKIYNRGVLNALNKNVPHGTLDNHQIRRLKKPRVVYQCFMEQCAVDGTLESQDWCDRIYDHLRDFEISEYSKSEIKETVEREAEIAGYEYFFTKYSVKETGVSDSEFEIEEKVEPSDEKNRSEKQADLLSLQSHALALSCHFLGRGPMFNYLRNSDDPPMLLCTEDDDLREDIASGNIKAQVIIDSINRSYNVDNGFAFAFKFRTEKKDDYFLILTVDGFFFFLDNMIAFTKYESILFIEEDKNKLEITTVKTEWFSLDGSCKSGDNSFAITKTPKNTVYINPLRHCIYDMVEACGGNARLFTDVEFEIKDSIERHINKIAKSTSAKAYIVSEFDLFDDKNEKKLNRALSKYARKVRKDEVIAFIDTSFFGNGGDGILFSKYGISFDYAFEKVYAKYDEITRTEIINKGKELALYGRFSERKNDRSTPTIDSIFFDLDELKECLDEILYVI